MYLNFDKEGIKRLVKLEDAELIGYRFYKEMKITDMDSFSVEITSVRPDISSYDSSELVKVKDSLVIFFKESGKQSQYTISKEGFFNRRKCDTVIFELTENPKYNIITPDDNKKWKGKIDLRHNQSKR